MERSLRATGCDLPLKVIPYDDNLFDLPKGATWWEMPEMSQWLRENSIKPALRKYQCLTIGNYQFVDSDVCFIKDPVAALEPHTGFITSCGHWRDPNHIVTDDFGPVYSQRGTMWQQYIFNSGQFACDRPLYTFEALKATVTSGPFRNTCFNPVLPDQGAINLLVLMSEVPIYNVTLPPCRMESTWAGDYTGDYKPFWADEARTPYLIHWAGVLPEIERPIHDIFEQYLTREEKAEWDEEVRQAAEKRAKSARSMRNVARKSKRALLAAKEILS